jgi:molybdopterin molybdotransferase
MPELFQVLTPWEAFQRLEPYLTATGRAERVVTKEALGRVVAEDIFASGNLPPSPRSAMDGYAVRAEDTHGASEGLPAYLKIIDEVPMGYLPQRKLSEGEAALIHTGGLTPEGANAVIMVENTQKVDASTILPSENRFLLGTQGPHKISDFVGLIEVLRPVAEGENVLQRGEDLHQGESLLSKGHLLRPQDIGGLLALGVTEVLVFQRPLVAIISTGDELVPPEAEPTSGQVRDINAYTLSALTLQASGIPLPLGIVPDNHKALREVVRRGIKEADMVVISAGSSVSTRDITAQVINSLGKPGVLVHGISIKPGKPTILALVDHKPIFGLAGNPVSAIVTYDLFVTSTIYRLSGCSNFPVRPLRNAKLTRNIPSISGREDYVPVKLSEKDGELWAEPVFGKSNLIFTLIKADGLAQVPLDKAGIEAGDIVTVRLF